MPRRRSRIRSLGGVAGNARPCGNVDGVLDIEHVDFVSIPTRDPVRARRFYSDLLGLPPGSPNPDEFETPNLTLALWQPEAEGVPFAPNTAGIALRVPDVQTARKRLRAASSSWGRRLIRACA
jgi:catechol 2,3-dioxygenase-like lactoylglutathione lyase family enzyme